jgi:hypothetical protein
MNHAQKWLYKYCATCDERLRPGEGWLHCDDCRCSVRGCDDLAVHGDAQDGICKHCAYNQFLASLRAGTLTGLQRDWLADLIADNWDYDDLEGVL